MNSLKCAVPLLLVACVAQAEETAATYQHRGSLGGYVATGSEFVSSSVWTGDSGFRWLVEAGGTVALGEKFELKVSGRLTPWPGLLSGAILAGLRGSYGYAQFKTFFDFDLLLHLASRVDGQGQPISLAPSVGPHLALGAQYDFSQVAGVYAALGGTIGFGNGLRSQFELLVGLQFRTYIFE